LRGDPFFLMRWSVSDVGLCSMCHPMPSKVSPRTRHTSSIDLQDWLSEPRGFGTSVACFGTVTAYSFGSVALVPESCGVKCEPAVTFWRPGVGLCLRSGNAAGAPDLGRPEGGGSFPSSDHPRRETARFPASCRKSRLLNVELNSALIG
jgi:hypothetical protein